MVSIIVPTYNREDCLYSMLESLDRQRGVDFEVIVVDQSERVCDKRIARILGSCKNLKYYQVDVQGRSVSKNFGIEKATMEIILFCDDDIIVEENFLLEHVRIHNTYKQVGGVSCQLVEPGQDIVNCAMPLKITKYGRCINIPNSSYDGYVSSLNGGNMSFKRTALEEVGFFEENLRGTSMLEEPDIAFRLMMKGYKLYFSAGTRVNHYPQYNGNITTKVKHKRDWLMGYFFNQYFFMFKNRRVKYSPLLVFYLVYRSLVEGFKVDRMPVRFLDVPFITLWQGYLHWKKERVKYKNAWYTPRISNLQALKFKGN